MDKTILYCSGSFIGGAALAAFATWMILSKKLEKKYSNIADEEIASVKERFTVPKISNDKIEKKSEDSKVEKFVKAAMDKPSLSEYVRKLKDGGYTNYSDSSEVKAVSGRYSWAPDNNEIHIISPDDFGSDEDYDCVSLTFYADGILGDEDDTIIDHPDEVIGDALEHIGEFEDDAIHVCNPIKKIYYEILVDNRSYKDATGKTPHPKDGEDK